MKLRSASHADRADLQRLIAAFRDHLGARAPSEAQIEASLPGLLADPMIEFTLACADRGEAGATGEALGYAHLRYHRSLWSAGLGAHLEDLFVAERARRRGLGRALLEHAAEQARARGAVFVSLSTNERNADGLRLYLGAGFELQSEARYGDGREICLVRALREPDP